MDCEYTKFFALCVVGCIVGFLVYSHLAFKCHYSLQDKVILVTGCDTGFGNAIAKKLGKMGAIVFAGCLQEKTRKELDDETGKNVYTCLMDVTKSDEISKIVSLVNNYCNDNNTYLYGIVNNAGIAEFCPFECTSAKIFDKIIQVNTFGVTNICRAFIPLIRNSKTNGHLTFKLTSNNSYLFGLINRGRAGRIVNIASVAGRVPTPYLTAYHASKFAVVGFSDSLRYEMQKFFNIWVSTVEPSFTKTPMLVKGARTDNIEEKWQTAVDDHDNKDDKNGVFDLFNVYNCDEWVKYMTEQESDLGKLADGNIDSVVRCVICGLSSVFPLRWYYPNWQARILVNLQRFLPPCLTQCIMDLKFLKHRLIK